MHVSVVNSYPAAIDSVSVSSFRSDDFPTLGNPIIATRPSPLLATSNPLGGVFAQRQQQRWFGRQGSLGSNVGCRNMDIGSRAAERVVLSPEHSAPVAMGADASHCCIVRRSPCVVSTPAAVVSKSLCPLNGVCDMATTDGATTRAKVYSVRMHVHL